MIDLVFISHNRLAYTQKALSTILCDKEEQFNLYIWDNASTDGTKEFLRDSVKDPRIKGLILSKTNVGQTEAVNEIWGASKAELLGKLDNDCMVTPGWTRTLAQAHAEIPRLGVVACWHYFSADFDDRRASHKIQRFANHSIVRHPWTCGTGFLIKRETFEDLGPMRGGATTRYWIEMAKRGYINGFYYPLILQEHMDDPMSEHSNLKDEESYQEAKKVTYSLKNLRLNTLSDRLRIRAEILSKLLDGPWEVEKYLTVTGRLSYWFQKQYGHYRSDLSN